MFEAFETSRFLGRPVHLFLFTLQGNSYRFASGARDMTIGSGDGARLYRSAAGIERSAVNETSERSQNKLTIKMPFLLNPAAAELPVTQEFGRIFRPFAPSGRVSVVCMKVHSNDPDLRAVIEWTGLVVSPRFTDTTLTLTCERNNSRKGFRGNTGRFTRGCWKALYQCGVAMSDHAVAAVLSYAGGATLRSAAFAAFPAGRLEGGVVVWGRANGLVETRTINSHSGDTITLNYPGPELAEGLEVTVAPGCAHTHTDCGTYFQNTPNYGGQPQLNVENPFDGHRISW
ncbi:phage BR0599 family protein [Stenotrophomonas maltophilia]|nr:phage BR0599 family protein [Stenotrophomonas maltophilia]WQI22634.1 phage BR0599 family protein [Stenotrophomonas maltophilia]